VRAAKETLIAPELSGSAGGALGGRPRNHVRLRRGKTGTYRQHHGDKYKLVPSLGSPRIPPSSRSSRFESSVAEVIEGAFYNPSREA
jgi:hypothetical protein